MYSIQDNIAYWRNTPLESADPATFVAVNEVWAVDKAYVWVNGNRKIGVDHASFRVLNVLFAKDDNRAYHIDGVIKDADAATFEALDCAIVEFTGDRSIAGYARDKSRVYHNTYSEPAPSVLRNADPATFAVLGYHYARDRQRVYHAGEALLKAEPASFRLIGERHGSDAERIYVGSHLIEGADAATFTVLHEGLAQDATRVYYQNRIVDADVHSLAVVHGAYYRDKDHVFYCGSVISGADPATFEAAGGLYFRDKNRVYFQSKPIVAADPATFQHLRGPHARDKRAYYYNGVAKPFRDMPGEYQDGKGVFGRLADILWRPNRG
jgi:hypothetical protein